jgi:membrane-associated phospholipid phosphatase
MKNVVIIFLLSISFWACTSNNLDLNHETETVSVDRFSSELQTEWMSLYLDLERSLTELPLTNSARVLAYINIGAYEVLQPGMASYVSLSESLEGYNAPAIDLEKPYYWPAALNNTYAELILALVPGLTASQIDMIQSLKVKNDAYLSRLTENNTYLNSIEWSNRTVNAVVHYANSDARALSQIADPMPTDFQMESGEGMWNMNNTDSGRALHPYWGEVRSFSIRANDVHVHSPKDYNTDTQSEYFNEAMEVYNTARSSAPVNRWVGEFWSDDLPGVTFRPSSRMVAIANQIVTNESINMASAAELYAKLSIALNDVTVLVWKSKYDFTLQRPEEFIRSYIDNDFTNLIGASFGSPGTQLSYPSYPSEHAGFAGVGAGVISALLGENISFTDRCHEGRTDFQGAPRSFLSLNSMAVEYAFSRVNVGMHFPMCSSEGLRLGYEVSNSVNNNLKFR